MPSKLAIKFVNDSLKKQSSDLISRLNRDTSRDCTLWHPTEGFKPNPGAQVTLFTTHISLDPAKPNPSPARWIYYRGGINSGKSYSGAGFICANAKRDSQARQLITAGSYGQLQTSTLVALAEFCKRYKVPINPVADIDLDAPEWADLTAKKIAFNRFCTVFGAPVLVLSAEAFTGRTENSTEVGRGTQVRAVWADEFTYAAKSAFTTINGRLGRGVGSMKGIGLITSSINKNQPYNWAFDLFDSPDRSEDQQKRFVSIQGGTHENLYLDEDYLTSMQAGLTDELIRIELEGIYASISEGRILKYFDRTRHVKRLSLDPQEPIHISVDFNYSPTCAIASQYIDGTIIILKEWYLTNAGTFVLAEELAQWVKSNTALVLQIHGDASGNQKTANSKQTNWEIIFEALKRAGIRYQKRFGAANPEIQDSINASNAAFKQDRVFLADTCTELIKDNEAIQFDPKGKIDKSDLARGHLFDCERYLIQDLIPITRPIIYTPSFTSSVIQSSAQAKR